MKKVFFQMHKITGSLLSLLFLIWFASGIILIYQGYPHASREERFMHLETFSSEDFTSIKAPSSEFKGRIELEKHLGQMLYRVYSGSKSQKIYNATTLSPINSFSQDEAKKMATSFMNCSIKNIELINELDLWMPWSSYKRLLPIYKCQMDDALHTVLYISQKTGTILQQTNLKTRWAAYFGAIPHWMYFMNIRNKTGIWKPLIITLSSIGIAVCISGIVVGLFRFRRKIITPFKKFHYKWHHLIGFFFGIFAFTFVFSGLISVTGVPDLTDYGTKEKITWNQKSNLKQFEEIVPQKIWSSIKKPDKVRKIIWKNIFNTPHLMVYSNNYQIPEVYCFANNNLSSLTNYSFETIQNKAHKRFENLNPEVSVQSKYDNYYQTSGMLYTPLPVYKIELNNPSKTWLYVNPKTGEEIKRYTQTSRIRRWMYRALHSFNIQFLKQHEVLRQCLLIIISVFGIIMSFTGFVLSKRWFKQFIQ